MNDINLISRKSLQAEMKSKIERGEGPMIDLVDFSSPILSGRFQGMSQEQRFDAIAKMTANDIHPSGLQQRFRMSGKYGTGFDVPMDWKDGGKMMSVRERIRSGKLSPKMATSTLPVDWQNLWDAIRIDVSVRKASKGTIREFIYNISRNPNYTRTLKPTDINPFGVVFEEVTGHGDAIPQGETLGGNYDSFNIDIYAAGFTWDLVAELFDQTIDPMRISDAVMVGEDAKKDDLAIAPILAYSYSGTQQTAASTVGTLRQELLYNTLVDGVDDLGNRAHPVTGRKMNVNEVVILASSFDARHIAQVASGLPSSNERKYPALPEVRNILAYDSEVITLRDRTVTYTGVTSGKAYMIIPASSLDAQYMQIAVKRDLVMEVDMTPDLRTLSREQRAWWFAEGIWANGIPYFIQELTLPTW